jgi:hypothetical protein
VIWRSCSAKGNTSLSTAGKASGGQDCWRSRSLLPQVLSWIRQSRSYLEPEEYKYLKLQRNWRGFRVIKVTCLTMLANRRSANAAFFGEKLGWIAALADRSLCARRSSLQGGER